ncbi:hypothetical protein FEMY_04350 [Ferrovum myxofaciens]|uniref:Uncharacterized protein n=1 Tax=Ferrovum myxofaciens TaxID=416213 RepID=A0A149W0H3_9PROT|nr:hypothetical protein [Ferrovum myxofaciens]KXW58916.1 hypothetical protein FEMY_04350 [Ferrovum myxofaciens]
MMAAFHYPKIGTLPSRALAQGTISAAGTEGANYVKAVFVWLDKATTQARNRKGGGL